MIKTAEIIVVGNELLAGFYSDTNSAVICRWCGDRGITVRRILVIGDEQRRIVAALKNSRADLVFVSGGLGTTEDDRTRPALIAASRKPERYDLAEEKVLRRKLRRREIRFSERYRKMCYRPAAARFIQNDNGLASGIMHKFRQSTIIAVPGVPLEVAAILARLDVCLKIRKVSTKRIYGLYDCRETDLEDLLLARSGGRAESVAPSYSLLPSPGVVYVMPHGDRHLEAVLEKKLSNKIFTRSGEPLEQVIIKTLARAGKTLGCAESCTAGWLSKMLTDTPGSSRVFKGAVVAYDNQVKIKQLSVPRSVLKCQGAVSEPVARFMAINCRTTLSVDWAISITGIAGPGGGSKRKPVGLAWIGIAGPNDKVITHKLLLAGTREQVRYAAARRTLVMLYAAITNQSK